MTDRITGLIKYLNSLREEAIEVNGDDEVVNIATKTFHTLSGYFQLTNNGTLEVPDCCGATFNKEDFRIMFTWDNTVHYLECEIIKDGTLEFFYRNKLTKEIWGEDFNINNFKFDEELLNKLSHFTY